MRPVRESGDALCVLADTGSPRSLPSLAGEVQGLRDKQSRRPEMPYVICLVPFLLIAVKCAWICDDAYIGFRVADNFAHGYGLTWNVTERVQVYTAPLWILLVCCVNVVTHEVFFTSIALSLAFSTVAVVLLAVRLSRSPANLCLVIVAAVSSKAFMDYTTSGLENSLGYLLAAWFYLSFFRGASTFQLSLLGSLLILNRLDTILLVAPPLLLALVRRARRQDLTMTAHGAAPFLIWEAFSLLYYGSLVPNTAYAKLNTGIPRLDLLRQGFWYFVDSLTRDPVSIPLIALALIWAACGKDERSKGVAIGGALYLVYVAWIGGDYMSGRFFSLPFVTAMSLMAVQPLSLYSAGTVSLTALSLGLIMPSSPLSSSAAFGKAERFEIIDQHEISDERASYYPWTGLLNANPYMSRPFHPWAAQGEAARWSGRKFVGCSHLGFSGYFAGPSVYVFDPGALADALLSRLPAAKASNWKVGHFERPLPEGYLETLQSGENQIADQGLAKFYERLRLVISGPLLSPERLEESIRLAIGWDRPPLRRNEAPCRVPAQALTHEVVFPRSGIEIDLGRMVNSRYAHIYIENMERYHLTFLHGSIPVGEQSIKPPFWTATFDMQLYRVVVPTAARRQGFDRIQIMPIKAISTYFAVGGVSLRD